MWGPFYPDFSLFIAESLQGEVPHIPIFIFIAESLQGGPPTAVLFLVYSGTTHNQVPFVEDVEDGKGDEKA